MTGLLTDPAKFNVPVTPEEMADAAEQSHNAGASVLHCHFRDQREGMGAFPTWDIKSVGNILTAIKQRVPDIIICMSTGVLGDDISGPVGCLEAFKPEMAACNAGSLNYLKIRKDGNWAWPPALFDNPVEKVKKFLEVMTANNIIPEFECFDTGIVRSVAMYKANAMFEGEPHVSFVMGVDSGMPANPDLLPILKEELLPILTGRSSPRVRAGEKSGTFTGAAWSSAAMSEPVWKIPSTWPMASGQPPTADSSKLW